MPTLYAVAGVPDAGRSHRRWHGRRGGRRHHAGPRGHRRRQPIWPVRTETKGYRPSLASDRCSHRALAGADSRRDVCGGAYRSVDAARLPTQLQRPEVHSARYPGQCGICRCLEAFPTIIDDGTGHSVDRGRSRYAQSGRLSGSEQTGQGSASSPGCFEGSGGYAPGWRTSQAHHYSVHAQHE
ncbi:Uncharacterised protein [Mycobacteroides abscessus subsp. abscessus]|nr:Uncharacterised protein [Mycobacteroides abscessus subsp. abscessus]SKZ19105.1 Uncharacterised protein [Mycobacteroides abscessus subsp. abscessus]